MGHRASHASRTRRRLAATVAALVATIDDPKLGAQFLGFAAIKSAA